VPQEHKAVFPGDCILFRFDFIAAYFPEHPASNADDMIVVLVPEIVLVAHRPVAELDGPRNAGFGDKLQGPVNRGNPDLRVFFMNQLDQLIGGDVVFASKENVQDVIPPRAAADPFTV
jgi:hypothetical protein